MESSTESTLQSSSQQQFPSSQEPLLPLSAALLSTQEQQLSPQQQSLTASQNLSQNQQSSHDHNHDHENHSHEHKEPSIPDLKNAIQEEINNALNKVTEFQNSFTELKKRDAASLFYVVYQNILEMLHDHGYVWFRPEDVDIWSNRDASRNIPKYLISSFKISQEDFYKYTKYDVTRSRYHGFFYKEDPDLKTTVHRFFLYFGPGGRQTKAEDTKIFVDRITPYTTHKFIKLSTIFITPAIMKQTKKQIIDMPNIKVKVFYETEFYINVTKHILQPYKFEKMSEENKRAYFIKYNITKKPNLYLHRLDSGRPISRWYGFEKGDLIKITRWSPIIDVAIAYRLVD
jgi:DNA-directed RNA polymerase subunit H (RpoH/RPB5)